MELNEKTAERFELVQRTEGTLEAIAQLLKFIAEKDEDCVINIK